MLYNLDEKINILNTLCNKLFLLKQLEIDLQNVGDSYTNGSSKKILYFSDGTLEVENDNQDIPDSTSECKSLPVNLQKANWFPWMWYQTVAAGSKALELCDYVGESLASFFGITTPKYQFEINEYMRLQKGFIVHNMPSHRMCKSNFD
ncbi:conserved hypothetical protein [Pediculus humanus corporis]|uniref:Uncharacterized protein n=1 Tax=Pediculus humanus subsp. corporis TaxID=121224 RepID=E0VQM4_PEDHC|nr:uncharacterized protein Phum_PHUM379850 [Pediculus humanus corporis]EEB15680.1 conserved hypothetical protein [Pediculus humanus corporis]